MGDNGENRNVFEWVEQTMTMDAIDPAVKAIEANPGWKLLHVGTGSGGQTTLTYGWPWPDGQCHCFTYCERPDTCPNERHFDGTEAES